VTAILCNDVRPAAVVVAVIIGYEHNCRADRIMLGTASPTPLTS
jgi:hypothetical protein